MRKKEKERRERESEEAKVIVSEKQIVSGKPYKSTMYCYNNSKRFPFPQAWSGKL